MATTKNAKGQTFVLWLIGQQCRNDPVGDFAGDFLRDPSRPRSVQNQAELLRYLARCDQKVLDAASQAWAEFIW